MSDQEHAVETVETPKTVEQLSESLRKAEARIVELKTSTTPAEKQEEATMATTGFDENAFEKKYEEKKFFEANPDMLEYKDKLTEKTALGNSWADAKMLVENSDETIANRKIASQANFTSWDAPDLQQTSYTVGDLEKMNQSQYERAVQLQTEGKVKFT